MNILLTEPKDIHPEAVSLLKNAGHSIFLEGGNYYPDTIDVLLIRTYTFVDEAYLSQFPQVKFILRAGVGLENVDMRLCKEKKIVVFNSPGSNARAVAEYVLTTILLLLRKFNHQSKNLEIGKWRDRKLMGSELTNQTIGFIGCGAVVRALLKLLSGFPDLTYIGYDPYLSNEQLHELGIKKVDLPSLLHDSDIISLHLPLTAETRNLLSMKEITTMKKTAYLINSARGGIINETDLIKTLQSNTISGAALDVFDSEPNIRKELRNCPNLVLTPHVAGMSAQADRAMSVEVVERFISL